MNTQEFFSDVTNGSQLYAPINAWKPSIELSIAEQQIIDMFNQYGGSFYEHIGTSIPTYREIRAKIALSIMRMHFDANQVSVIEIGGSEGELMKTLPTFHTKFVTVNLEPNKDFVNHFVNHNQVSNARVRPYAFYEGFEGVDRNYNNYLFDIVIESMTFQFMGNSRGQYIQHVKDSYIKDSGLFICLEKVMPNGFHMTEFNENEIDLYDYKRQFYSLEQLRTKKEVVVESMHDNIVSEEHLVDSLKAQFEYVINFWQAGNFVGYCASNSIRTILHFFAEINGFKSAYTNRTFTI